MTCISFTGDIGNMGLVFGLGFDFPKHRNNKPTLRWAWGASMEAAVSSVQLPWEGWVLLLFPTKAHSKLAPEKDSQLLLLFAEFLHIPCSLVEREVSVQSEHKARLSSWVKRTFISPQYPYL